MKTKRTTKEIEQEILEACKFPILATHLITQVNIDHKRLMKYTQNLALKDKIQQTYLKYHGVYLHLFYRKDCL